MRRRRGVTWLTGLLVLAVLFVFGVAGAVGSPSDDPQHGISFSKGCTSPREFGEPYRCSYSVSNQLDAVNQAHDTLTFTSITDIVHASGGDVPRAS